MNCLYEKIKSLCDCNGISVYRLCKDIGIRGGIITDLKAGRKKGLSAATALKIASYFNISVEELFAYNKADNTEKSELETLIEIKEREENPMENKIRIYSKKKKVIHNKSINLTVEAFEIVQSFADATGRTLQEIASEIIEKSARLVEIVEDA